MSISGMWVMGAVPPRVFRSLLADIDVTQFEPVDDTADLEWWAAIDQAPLRVPGPEYYSPEAERFTAGLDSLRPQDEALAWRCIDTFRHTVDEGQFIKIYRKGDPVAAPCYGLTFSAARRLPGRAGCFLLNETEVASALATIGPILEDPPDGRNAFEDRAQTWIDIMTDAGEYGALDLLDGPLRVLRRAGETGSAVVAVMLWH